MDTGHVEGSSIYLTNCCAKSYVSEPRALDLRNKLLFEGMLLPVHLRRPAALVHNGEVAVQEVQCVPLGGTMGK